MADTFLDRLAGPERERVMKRLRSPEAYERLREKVKGPEDLEQELQRSERIAELHFALESDPAVQENMKSIVERALREGGVDHVVEQGTDLSDETRIALKDGRFRLAVSPDPRTHEDSLVLFPEGNVHEKVPVRTALMDACVSQLSTNA